MKLIRLMTIIVTLGILFNWNCGNFCNVYDVQEIDELAGGNAIVAYVVRCGATGHNSVSVTWKKEGLDLKGKRGEIFDAINGDYIKIEKVSIDTIKVYYLARDVKMEKEFARGITFVYEVRKPEFFKRE